MGKSITLYVGLDVHKVVRVDEANDPELFWGMRGNGASFGIVTEFVVRLRDMPNGGIIRGAPVLWPVDTAGGDDIMDGTYRPG